MLVLSRHKDEGIIIGNDIKIIVVEIRGDKVRLGIEAPRETPVHRQEVYYVIQKENFSKYLSSEKYIEAYELILKGYEPVSEDINKLEEGLRRTGKLDKSIEDKLDKYKN